MDTAIAKKLMALRLQDVALLESKLREVKDTHSEATARILRVEVRESAVQENQASLKLLQVQLEEQEQKLQEREKAAAEHATSLMALRAEVVHKAHELESTASQLQDRKKALEHRDKMLEQQTAHVKQLQELVSRTYEQHDQPKHFDRNKSENGIGSAAGRRALQPQQLAAGERKRSGAVGGHAGVQREKELQALAVLLQTERDRYFAQLQSVERLVDDFDCLPNTPGPLLDALRHALYP